MVICLTAIFLLYSVLSLRIWGMGFILWTDSYQRIGKDSFHSCYHQSWIWQRCIKIPQSSYCRYHFCLCCRFDQNRLLQNPPSVSYMHQDSPADGRHTVQNACSLIIVQLNQVCIFFHLDLQSRLIWILGFDFRLLHIAGAFPPTPHLPVKP